MSDIYKSKKIIGILYEKGRIKISMETILESSEDAPTDAAKMA